MVAVRPAWLERGPSAAVRHELVLQLVFARNLKDFAAAEAMQADTDNSKLGWADMHWTLSIVVADPADYVAAVENPEHHFAVVNLVECLAVVNLEYYFVVNAAAAVAVADSGVLVGG